MLGTSRPRLATHPLSSFIKVVMFNTFGDSRWALNILRIKNRLGPGGPGAKDVQQMQPKVMWEM